MFFIRGRQVWGAKPPKTSPTHDNWRDGVTVVVHHTAGGMPRTEMQEHAELRSIQRMHQWARDWNDIGYNYAIAPSGRVYEGRGWGVRGAHTENHNTDTIGISFLGNYDAQPPSRRALVAYRLLLRRLRKRGARIQRITGHRFMPGQSTACPGRHLVKALRLR